MTRWKNRFKNILIEWFFFLLKIHKKKKNLLDHDHPRILIVSTTALGDTLWATPATLAIKKKFPQSYVALLCQKRGAEVFRNNPWVDDIFSFEEPLFFSCLSLLSKLKEKKIQALLVFHASQRLVFPLCALLQAEKMISFRGKNKGLDFLFSHLVETQKVHELEQRDLLLKILEIPCTNHDLLYFTTPEEEERVDFFLKEKKISPQKPLIILHPGATDSYRRWPAQSFIELGNKLLQQLPCHLLISGGKTEQDLIHHIASQIKGSLPLFPPLPLRDFAALLKKCTLLIANDTGPLHLSLATKTKTLGLFLPTNPKITGPFKTPHGYVLSEKVPCNPCLQRKCKNSHCWEKITVDIVLNQIKEIVLKTNK